MAKVESAMPESHQHLIVEVTPRDAITARILMEQNGLRLIKSGDHELMLDYVRKAETNDAMKNLGIEDPLQLDGIAAYVVRRINEAEIAKSR